jgi:glycosyltransferase involved in cell wall biosynthesis
MTSSPELPAPDILFVIGGLTVGGAERHLSSIARAFVRKGWRVRIYSLTGDGPMRAEIEGGGVTVVVPPVDRSAIADVLILRVLRFVVAGCHLTYVMLRTRPRIVHFFLPSAYLVGAIAAALARVRTRVMSRRSLNVYQRAYLATRWIEMKLHPRMDAVLGNSAAVVQQLREEGIQEEKLGLIYNGIEFSMSSPIDRAAVRSSLDIDGAALVFIIVANLIPYKGHVDLIEAFGIADDEIVQPWRLLIVGRDDGAGPKIHARAQQLKIEDRVSLLGPRADVASLLAASDVGLLCSHQEGFANAILEAMAAGLPMIVTNVGGNAEAVLDGVTGLIVPPHDPQALARSIVHLARDPKLRQRYGGAGRERVESHFLLDTCVAKYEALYGGLLRGKTPRDIPEVYVRDR